MSLFKKADIFAPISSIEQPFPAWWDRFFSKVTKSRGCWTWNGCKDDSGYGLFRMNGKLYKAHRFIYEQFDAPIYPGLVVMHACDNPSCVNPLHLQLGTSTDNNIDRSRKGRSATGERSGARRLSETDIIEIRASKDGPAVLAARFNVTPQHICSIRRREYWTHI